MASDTTVSLSGCLKIKEICKVEPSCGHALPFFVARVSAGFPSPAEDYIEKKLDLHDLLVKHPAATFFVRVEGRSMEGAQIFSGDILIVDKSLQPKNDSIVVAVINGEFTVKRIHLHEGRLFLMPENSHFPPLEVKEEMDFQIWGVVTHVIHAL